MPYLLIFLLHKGDASSSKNALFYVDLHSTHIMGGDFRFSRFVLLTCLALIGANADTVGEIELDGTTLYVWRQYGGVTVQDGAITISGNSRAYLLNTPATVLEPDNFHQVSKARSVFLCLLFCSSSEAPDYQHCWCEGVIEANLVFFLLPCLQTVLSNRTLSYTIDLSHVPCHCNAPVVFDKMPAPEAGDALDYHCDANYVGGYGCPEFDAIEANKHTFQSAIHNCEWNGEWWDNCDSNGCSGNVWDKDSEAFGQ